MWPRQFNFIAKRSSFFFFNIVPAHCWSIWWRSRLQCCWFDDTDSLIFLPSTLFHIAFDNLLSLFLSIEITTLDILQWEIFFLSTFLFRDIKAFTKALLKYDQNTYFQFRHLRALSLSYKHNKRYFAFYSLMHLFLFKDIAKWMKFWLKIHRQRLRALFSIFSLDLSCFNIACIKNLVATRCLHHLWLDFWMEGIQEFAAKSNFSKGEDKRISCSGKFVS